MKTMVSNLLLSCFMVFIGCAKSNEKLITDKVSISSSQDTKTDKIPLWPEIRWGMTQSEVKLAMAENFYKIKIFDKQFMDAFVKINGIEFEISFVFRENTLERFKSLVIISKTSDEIDSYRNQIAKRLNASDIKYKFNGIWSLDTYKPNDNTEIGVDIKKYKKGKKQLTEIEIFGFWYGHYKGPE